MRPARRFAFGHEQAMATPAPQPVPSSEDKTGPLPVLDAPAAPVWQEQRTVELADMAAPAVPVLPFRAPILPVLREAVPIVPPHVEPTLSPWRRMSMYVAIGVALFAFYSMALVTLVTPRRAVDAPAPSAASPPALSALPHAPASSASTPALSITASASPPVASAPVPLATSQHPSPAPITRRPAPTHIAQPGSDVRNPWSYE